MRVIPVLPAENFEDVPDSLIEKHGREFAKLLGRGNWQGYKSDSTKRMGTLDDVRRAHVTPSA